MTASKCRLMTRPCRPPDRPCTQMARGCACSSPTPQRARGSTATSLMAVAGRWDPVRSQPLACRGPRSGTRPSQGGSARWHRPLAARRQAAETKAREEAETKANAVTFMDVVARYIAAHARSSRNAQHAARRTNSRPTYAAPVFGPIPVAGIDHELVLNVLTLGEQDRDPSSRPLPDRTGAELSQR